MKTFLLKTDVRFGEDALDYLLTLTAQKVYIVTDKMMQQLGFVDEVVTRLTQRGLSHEVFSDVTPDPHSKIVVEGLKHFINHQPDVMIAIGGGSVIDAAKAILYTYAKLGRDEESLRLPRLIAIPTTSGTGSEVTAFSVITADDEKLCLIDEMMTPDIAIVDPRFVKSVPANVTAETGIDALSHALEAYVSTEATDFTDALVEKAVRLIFENLLLIYQNGNDMVAREKVHNASCMAGIAFTNAALGITHSLAHAVGGQFKLPHGRAIGVMLPHVMAYNADLQAGANTKAAKKYAKLAQLLGLPVDSTRTSCQYLIQAITVLLQELGMATQIRQYDIDEFAYDGNLRTLATLALADNCTATNPRKPVESELIALLKQAY